VRSVARSHLVPGMCAPDCLTCAGAGIQASRGRVPEFVRTAENGGQS
jgi:hypothetical protein